MRSYRKTGMVFLSNDYGVTWSEMTWKSSRVSLTPALLAMARRCRTALVEPPRA
jgi:hypothetical protein